MSWSTDFEKFTKTQHHPTPAHCSPGRQGSACVGISVFESRILPRSSSAETSARSVHSEGDCCGVLDSQLSSRSHPSQNRALDWRCLKGGEAESSEITARRGHHGKLETLSIGASETELSLLTSSRSSCETESLTERCSARFPRCFLVRRSVIGSHRDFHNGALK